MRIDPNQFSGTISGMGLEQDILALFRQAVTQCNGNKSKAAKMMDVTPVTLSYWLVGQRRISPEACKAVDRLGGKLFMPEGDIVPIENDIISPVQLLQQQVDALTRENALLRKLVDLYEKGNQ